MFSFVEVHRVNWLRAKASFDRATEEVILVKYEMQWTIRYFEHQVTTWRRRREEGCSMGHIMYATKQVAMWAGLAGAAKQTFDDYM